MKIFRRSLARICCALLLLTLSIYCPSLAQAPITVETIHAPVSALTVSDVDFVHSTTPKWLFTIVIRSASPTTVTLKISLRAHLISGEGLCGESPCDVVTLETTPLAVNSSRTITNLDLRDPLLRQSYVVNEPARRRLADIALPSGVLPAGRYLFTVAPGPSSPVFSETEFVIVLSNPSTVELLSPVDRDESVNAFPFFQWHGDAANWHMGVYLLLPGQSSYEEAISGVPYLDERVTTQSFQYPSAGARPLQPGSTYVWFVEGLTQVTAGGETGFRSELRSFTVASGSESNTSLLLAQLEQALGPKYRSLFDQIRAEGLSPTGSIRLNGSSISISDLLGLLTQIQNNPDAVSAVLE